ncbi:S26 family signal peptidase [Sphingobium sp. BS19]|uniref:S26 family signal peptidase n=1 Tax=Sphingobium sp. BS19 TaxID=3018973 RepID=UPI0022EF425B|nr:S26 family signal peptidase [Sphingobium sp. BS19]GLI98012.1 peptidase S26 [Sphingobium sp. BS19]
MTSLGYCLATTLAAAVFSLLFLLVVTFQPQPRLLWNASASAPIGLYRIHPGASPTPGRFAAIMPPPAISRLMAKRHYLAEGTPLLKKIAATAGARVCRTGLTITINGRQAAIARVQDQRGRALPIWCGCRTLQSGEMFLLNAAPDSFDGRYFGPVSARSLIGMATPILTRETANAPLRWHGPLS